jgi:hypothetical protein
MRRTAAQLQSPSRVFFALKISLSTLIARRRFFANKVSSEHLTMLLSTFLSPVGGRSLIRGTRHNEGKARALQSKFLAYRSRYILDVRDAELSLIQFKSATGTLASVLEPPLVNAPELKVGLVQLLRNHEESASATRYTDIRFVVLEAVLYHIHKDLGARVTVGKIAETVMSILKGRGHSSTYEAREVGEKLRDLGLAPKRTSNGYSFKLDETFSRRVHQLADHAALSRGRQQNGNCKICIEASSCVPNRVSKNDPERIITLDQKGRRP